MQSTNTPKKIKIGLPNRTQHSSIEQYFQPLFISAVIYPLKRIQANFQIKQTYMNQEIRNCKEFFTRCTHYGLRSWFRGLIPYLGKISIPYIFYNSFEHFAKSISLQTTKTQKQQTVLSLQALGLAIGYSLIYPLENARLRMGGTVEKVQTYFGVRDCLNKMRKVQGKSSYFRGFGLSLIYVELQYFLTTGLYKYLTQSPQTSNLNPFSLFIGSFIASQLLIYPLDSIRKLVQINGALNHNNINPRYRDVLKLYKFNSLYSGFGFKLLTGFLYTAVMISIDKNRQQNKQQINY